MRGKVLEESTAQRIKEAARDIFFEKGYDGATMQAIADRSQVNKALLHYYYRCKNNLFLLIFGEEFQRLLQIGQDTLLDPSLPLHEKLERWVEREYRFLSRMPQLPLFLINEFQRNPDLVLELLRKVNMTDTTRQLKKHNAELSARGCGVSMEELFTMVISLLFFPFMGAPIVRFMWDLSPARWDEVREKQFALIKELVRKYVG